MFYKVESNVFLFVEFVLVMWRLFYYVGDVCVLRLIYKNEVYKDLYDCIVFFNWGICLYVIECVGGWVGGDKYFVCWD